MRITKAERERNIENARRSLDYNAPTGYRFGIMVERTPGARRARVFQGSLGGRVFNVTGAVSDLTSLTLTKTDWLSIRGHGYSASDDIKARLEKVLGVPVTVDTL